MKCLLDLLQKKYLFLKKTCFFASEKRSDIFWIHLSIKKSQKASWTVIHLDLIPTSSTKVLAWQVLVLERSILNTSSPPKKRKRILTKILSLKNMPRTLFFRNKQFKIRFKRSSLKQSRWPDLNLILFAHLLNICSISHKIMKVVKLKGTISLRRSHNHQCPRKSTWKIREECYLRSKKKKIHFLALLYTISQRKKECKYCKVSNPIS